MITIALDKNNSAITETTDGYTTLKTLSGPAEASQNVKLRLLIIRGLKKLEPDDAIDWMLFFREKQLRPVLGQKIQTLIANTPGVDSVDLSKAGYELNPPRFRWVCFTVGCESINLNL